MAKRKMTEAEKFERKAQRINAKRRAEAPLFADQVELTTGAEQCWRWRRNKAQRDGTITPDADGVYRYDAVTLLGVLRESTLRELARRQLPADAFEGLWAYRLQTYPRPGPEYGIAYWDGILTGTKRVVFGYRKVGEKQTPYGTLPVVVEDQVWPPEGWRAPYTGEQLRARFAWEGKPTEQPDDGGLEDLCRAVLERCKQSKGESHDGQGTVRVAA
jgi:hypothetical protein